MTLEYLKSILHYDPETGIWTWLVSPRNSVPKGSIAGSLHNKGYWHISIKNRKYLSHVLAWFYMTGEWAPNQIDHENMTKFDNRWCNLRSATQTQNQANKRIQKNNTTGYKGVTFKEGKYVARIGLNGRKIFLGQRNSAIEAAELYKEASIKYFGNYRRI